MQNLNRVFIKSVVILPLLILFVTVTLYDALSYSPKSQKAGVINSNSQNENQEEFINQEESDLIGVSPTATVKPTKSYQSADVTTEQLRVIEIRYFPKGEQDVIYHPDTLSAQLQTNLETASKFHGYSNANAQPAIDVQVVKVFNRYKARPNIDNDWYKGYKVILQEDNICQLINELEVDQIWMWVDPRTGYDPNPGMEYVISSNYFQNGVQYATVATPAFCNGTRSFVFMGFDTTRTWDLAMQSFGHYLEGILGNLQTIELFWYRFAGNTAAGWPITERCGNVHFPHNYRSEYDYSSPNVRSTACENWDPYLTGTKVSRSCIFWGCNQGGYLTWWMQNMPNQDNTLVYQTKNLPSWFDFWVDLDETIPRLYSDSAVFMDRSFVDANSAPNPTTLTPTPSIYCDQGYLPVCGSNGQTYFNKCQADLAGISIACNQVCPCN